LPEFWGPEARELWQNLGMCGLAVEPLKAGKGGERIGPEFVPNRLGRLCWRRYSAKDTLARHQRCI
jgi:hypothetical protein